MTATLVEHIYRPRGACRDLWDARDDEVLVSGPAGTGKSRACLEKLHMMALLNEAMRGLILRKTQLSLAGTALVTFREHVAREALATGVCYWYGGSRQEAAGYRYPKTGAFIAVGGLDKPTKIMSSEYDIAYVQEAIELTENDWESVTTRLRNGKVSFQQLIADTNPDRPTHWLKVRCDGGKTRILESRHEDNPVYFDDHGQITEAGRAYLAKLDRLTGPRYHRLRKGLWVAAEGIIYEEYDPAVHLLDRFDIPASWTRWWTVDFGYRNPFVLQWWAEDPDGRLYLYREIYMTGRLVEDHARQALSLVRRAAPHVRAAGREPDPKVAADWEWTEPKPRAVVCDHDAEDRATLERHLGIGTSAAHKTVGDGIQHVQARLKTDGRRKAGLYLLRDSLVERDPELVEAKKPTCTAEEIPGYIWAPGPDGKPLKEEPLKRDDHGADALRYMVAEKDLGARPRVRMLG